MKYLIAGFICLVATIVYAETPKSEAKPNSTVPRVELKTNLGKITLELMPEQAPVSVENFLSYAQAGFYKGTIFHRILNGYLIQGGGYTTTFELKSTRPPIINEASNGLKNSRGTVAMARLPDPNSATSQFFINTADNNFLDQSSTQLGYSVFGKVVEGMDVVDKIQNVPIKSLDNIGKNVPVDAIIIEDVRVENMPLPKIADTKPADKPVDKPIEKSITKPEIAPEVKPEKQLAETKPAEKSVPVEKTVAEKPKEIKPLDKPVETAPSIAKIEKPEVKETKPETSAQETLVSTPPDEPSVADQPIPMMH